MALSNLRLRILSAVILAPFVFAAIILGGWPFGVFVALAFGLSCGEWQGMSSKLPHRTLALLVGILYFIASFTLFVKLRIEHDSGLYLLLVLMLCVWASDTGAYILGRLVGGPKMAPNISPNKTWSGMAGSIIAAALTLTALIWYAPTLSGIVVNDVSARADQIPLLLLYGGVLGYVGQAGDLLESFMKRKAGMKDSGTLIPGHGGILDRIDALLLIIPVFYVVIHFGL